MGEAPRWLGRRLAVAASLPLLAALLTGCGGEAADCEDLFVRTISAVDGVESVDADCSMQLGGGWQRVDVHLATDDDAEASDVGEAVLLAVAEEPAMDAGWMTPRAYYLHDGTEATIGLRDMGFNGVPTVGEVRDHFGIATPPDD